MQEIIKREFLVKGLHCANCAAKMEGSINNIFGVNKAYVDFMGKRLILEYSNLADGDKIINETVETMNNIEQGIEIIEKKEGHNMKIVEKAKMNSQIIKLIASLILFSGAYLFNLTDIRRLAILSAAL